MLIPRSPSTARTFRTWKEKKSEAEISVYLWISLDILLQGRWSWGWEVKFMFSKEATKIGEIFKIDYAEDVKLTMKISTIFVAFLNSKQELY